MAKYAPDMVADKKDQLEQIEGICLPDELIHAVFDLKGQGTGFIGLTNKWIIFYDKEFAKKAKAIVSIPYNRVATVGSEDKWGLIFRKGFMVSDKLYVGVSGQAVKEFEFRGGDKAHQAHDIIMTYVLN
ncbi:hypothetical protein KKB3_00908 [Dehalococcoides mccartyi]|nr:hypothetical protein KKB3_00908 [Dehalococcoides mccartyi]